MTDYSDKLVLVADDEPGMVAMVGGYLRGKGFQVIEASDGALAWDLAHERLPDLVILDVMMPGMSGWEVCRKIKEAVSLHHTGVIMLTGIGENLNEMTSPLYGADAYLDKPFDFDDLSAKIDETLNLHAGISNPADTDNEPRKPVKKRPKKASPNQASLFIDDPEEALGSAAKPAKPAAKKAPAKPAKKAPKKSKPAAKKAPAKPAKKSKPAVKKAPAKKSKPSNRK